MSKKHPPRTQHKASSPAAPDRVQDGQPLGGASARAGASPTVGKKHFRRLLPLVCLGAVLITAAAFLMAPHQSTPSSGSGSKPQAQYVPRPKGTLTFAKDVAPIVFAKCASCHRPGQAAPFNLLSYADVQKRARQIADVTA